MSETFINIADIKDKSTGKTYREMNLEKVHNIPLGTLVEVDFDDSYLEDPVKGLRLYVVEHSRDCDGTPLYSLSHVKKWSENMMGEQFKVFARWMLSTGYSESSLKIIKEA